MPFECRVYTFMGCEQARVEKLEAELLTAEMAERGLRSSKAKAAADADQSKAAIDLAHLTTQRLERQLASARDKLRRQDLVIKVLHAAVLSRGIPERGRVSSADGDWLCARTCNCQCKRRRPTWMPTSAFCGQNLQRRSSCGYVPLAA